MKENINNFHFYEVKIKGGCKPTLQEAPPPPVTVLAPAYLHLGPGSSFLGPTFNIKNRDL